MPRKKLADDLMQSNEEYTKLKTKNPPDRTPRENPDHQAPGNRGLTLPDLEKWETAEIRQHALSIGIEDAGELDRDDLIAAILELRRRGAR